MLEKDKRLMIALLKQRLDDCQYELSSAKIWQSEAYVDDSRIKPTKRERDGFFAARYYKDRAREQVKQISRMLKEMKK